MDAHSSRKLLVRLAAKIRKPEKPEKLDDEYSYYRESDSYRAALIRCALRAASLGLSKETVIIHEVACPRRYNFYVLHDPFHTEHIAPWLLSVVARAAAEDRQVTLLDCVPSELRQLVQDVEIPQTDEAQEQLLMQKLERPSGASDEEKRTRLSAGERQRAPDYLRQRIRPLLALARHIADAIKAKSTTELEEAVSKLFDSWKVVQLQARKSTYFDRELTRFLDSLYSPAPFRRCPPLVKLPRP